MLFGSSNRPIRDWRGQRVWIVGASSGIGEALARRLAGEGASVAVSARSADRLEAVAMACGNGAVAEPMDVTRAQDYEMVRNRLWQRWGGVDLVVLNAGTYRPLRAWELTPEAIHATVATNLEGVMNGVASVVPSLMQQRRGAIAIVASVAGYGGLPKSVIYGPTKAALINFAESLYLDLAPRGVSVFLVNPGFVDTPLTADNDFHMPALMRTEEAADAMVSGFASGAFEIHFPRRFTTWLRLLRWVPRRAYFALIRRATGIQ